MGETRELICRDHEEYVDIDKLYFPPPDGDWDEWFSDGYNQQWMKNLLAFMSEHRTCNIALIGEYVGQEEWLGTHTWDEFDPDHESE